MSSHYPEIDGHKLTDFIHELPFYLGNVMKYAWRAPYKGGIEDMLKLLDYLDRTCSSWQKYDLSSRAISLLTELSINDFYSQYEGIERIHRKCIGAVADLVLRSDECGLIDYDSKMSLTLRVASMQVALMNK